MEGIPQHHTCPREMSLAWAMMTVPARGPLSWKAEHGTSVMAVALLRPSPPPQASAWLQFLLSQVQQDSSASLRSWAASYGSLWPGPFPKIQSAPGQCDRMLLAQGMWAP